MRLSFNPYVEANEQAQTPRPQEKSQPRQEAKLRSRLIPAFGSAVLPQMQFPPIAYSTVTGFDQSRSRLASRAFLIWFGPFTNVR